MKKFFTLIAAALFGAASVNAQEVYKVANAPEEEVNVVPGNLDLSTVDTSESQGGNLHYMADGDENCPRLDYPGAGSVAKFQFTVKEAQAFKISFNYATPMDNMFMTWIITDADGKEVYNEMFNIEPTGAPGDYWTIYKDFDAVPETGTLAAGKYTLTMKYNIDKSGNVIPGSYDGSENAAFHINIKSITFAKATGAAPGGEVTGEDVTVDLSAVSFVTNANNSGSWNGEKLDFYQFGDVVSVPVVIAKDGNYKPAIDYATIMSGLKSTWAIQKADGTEVWSEVIDFPYTTPDEGTNNWTFVKTVTSTTAATLAAGSYNVIISYDHRGLWEGSDGLAFQYNVHGLKLVAVAGGAPAAGGTTLYSWTGAEAGATEIGGKATCTNEGNVNKKNTANGVDYYTIVVSGKADWSGDLVTITLDNELEADDQIAITGYRNKDAADKQTGALIKFDKGDETVSTAQTGLEYPNLNPDNDGDSNAGTEPSTVTVSVPASAAGSKVLTITRAKTQTNLFITALKITRGGAATAIEAVQAVKVAPVNNFIYNLAGQRVDANYKGVVIKNGKKYLQK